MTDHANDTEPAAPAPADAAPLPDVEAMELRERLVITETQLSHHRSAILLLSTGIALLAIVIVLRTRRTA